VLSLREVWEHLFGQSSGPVGLAERAESQARPAAPLSSALSDNDFRTASALFLLLSDFPAWVRRRVEYIDFIDDVSVTRRVSVDFAVPEPLEGFTEVDEELLPCVPLTFLLKGDVLRNFDLRDAQGNPVPMLTKDENGTLAGNSLIYLAEEVLQVPLIGTLAPLAERLRAVAEGPREEARAQIDNWQREARSGVGPHPQELRALTNRPGFIRYAETLAENYILFAVGPPEPNRRRLMKFGYEEPFKLGEDPDAPEDEQLPRRERWRERLGWRVKTVNLAMPAVNLAASFHAEVPAPPDMEVQFAQLVFKRAGGAANDGCDSGESGAGSGGPDGDGAPELPGDVLDGPLVQRAHLYKSGVDASAVADALIYLRARRPGFLRAAVLTGWLTFALLVGGFVYLDDIASSANSQTAAALLLLGPTLLAGSLIRPGEHRMAASVLIGVRCLLAAEVGATVLAVGLLAGAGAFARHDLWLLATATSGLAAAGLAVSYLWPRPTEG
jgi:hypothetical protein